MLGQVKWTPNSFVIEHKEIIIVFKIMDQLNYDILLGMSKRTELPVFTVLQTIRIKRTEFGFVGIILHLYQ
jgi:hypothetical protein